MNIDTGDTTMKKPPSETRQDLEDAAPGKGPSVTLQDTASLHEKAVQAIAKGEVKKPRKKRKPKTKKQVADMRHVKVIPEVWNKANEIRDAKNTYTRIEIVNNHEVIVR